MPTTRVTVELLIDETDEGRVADAVHAILTEQQQSIVPGSALIDWQYAGGRYNPALEAAKAKLATTRPDTKQLLDLLRDAHTALEWQEMADADPSAAERKGYYDIAREHRRTALRRINEAGVGATKYDTRNAQADQRFRENTAPFSSTGPIPRTNKEG